MLLNTAASVTTASTKAAFSTNEEGRLQRAKLARARSLAMKQRFTNTLVSTSQRKFSVKEDKESDAEAVQGDAEKVVSEVDESAEVEASAEVAAENEAAVVEGEQAAAEESGEALASVEEGTEAEVA